MSIDFPVKERYTMPDLLALIAALRSPEGCPWDREQTHESIRSNFLEETHEAIEAINNGDTAGLREELGDVLMQVVLHTQMAEEDGEFTFDDVVNEVCCKLIVRHPHVFGDVEAKDSAAVLKTWDSVKRATKGEHTTQADILRSVPRTLPALMRAGKVQNRARRVGFDWPNVSGALEAVDSEILELKAAIQAGRTEEMEEELGDLLFSVVNVSRFIDLDAEQALTVSTDKFITRFEKVEALAASRSLDMSAMSITELDDLWKEAKDLLK